MFLRFRPIKQRPYPREHTFQVGLPRSQICACHRTIVHNRVTTARQTHTRIVVHLISLSMKTRRPIPAISGENTTTSSTNATFSCKPVAGAQFPRLTPRSAGNSRLAYQPTTHPRHLGRLGRQERSHLQRPHPERRSSTVVLGRDADAHHRQAAAVAARLTTG